MQSVKPKLIGGRWVVWLVIKKQLVWNDGLTDLLCIHGVSREANTVIGTESKENIAILKKRRRLSQYGIEDDLYLYIIQTRKLYV